TRLASRSGRCMVHEDIDSYNAARRDAILMSPEDAKRLGPGSGDRGRVEEQFRDLPWEYHSSSDDDRHTADPLAGSQHTCGSQRGVGCGGNSGLQKEFLPRSRESKKPYRNIPSFGFEAERLRRLPPIRNSDFPRLQTDFRDSRA